MRTSRINIFMSARVAQRAHFSVLRVAYVDAERVVRTLFYVPMQQHLQRIVDKVVPGNLIERNDLVVSDRRAIEFLRAATVDDVVNHHPGIFVDRIDERHGDANAIAGKPAERASEAFRLAFDQGVLIRTTGDTIALSPPLIIEKAQIDRIMETLADVLRAVR